MKKSLAYALLRATVVAAFLVLIGRLWYMQVVQVDAYRSSAIQRRTAIRIVQAPRGIIYDSRGRPLVRNLPQLNVTVTPAEWDAKHGKRESRLLAKLLHHHPRASRIRWLIWREVQTTGIVTSPVVVREHVSYRTFLKVEANTNRMPGVTASSSLNRRHYLEPAPYPLAHLLGYTGSTDSVGQAGLESVFERQ